MLRFASSALVMLVIAGFVVAGTYTGLVTDVGDKEVKVKVKKDKKDKEGVEKTFKLSKDAKFVKKTKDSEEEVKADAIKEMIEKSKVKGVIAVVTTDGEGDKEVVTKITLAGGKKKKDK